MLQHSKMLWTYDQPVGDGLIREIVSLMLNNRNICQQDNYVPEGFVPQGTVDRLALDAAALVDEHGIADEAMAAYSRKSKNAQKAYLIMSLVRGTLIANGALQRK